MTKAKNPTVNLIKNKEGVINVTETLFQQRKIFLYDAVTEDSVEDLIQDIMILESISNDPIEFYINSPGGLVDEGFALIDVMRKSKCKIITIAQGSVASMGTLIFIAGHVRKCYKHTVLMYHDLFAGIADYSQKMKSRMDFYDKEWKMIEAHVKQYTKLTDKDCEEMRSGELWIFADEAKEKGCVDEII